MPPPGSPPLPRALAPRVLACGGRGGKKSRRRRREGQEEQEDEERTLQRRKRERKVQGVPIEGDLSPPEAGMRPPLPSLVPGLLVCENSAPGRRQRPLASRFHRGRP